MHASSSLRALGALAMLVLLTGCGPGATATPTSGAATAAAPTSAAATATEGALGSPSAAVEVTLQEWAVVPSVTSTGAGDVTFDITNTGPEDEHEFVILRTDLDPAALPVDSTGAVDESGAGITVVDEVEEIAVGASGSLTAPLTAGKYVLICNIYTESENEAHYKMGMRTPFEVTS